MGTSGCRKCRKLHRGICRKCRLKGKSPSRPNVQGLASQAKLKAQKVLKETFGSLKGKD